MSPQRDLALYIHWPFCVSKCPYCDFNSHVRESVDQAAWLEALLTDMRHEAGMITPRPLASIFFGGGTPSLMPPATVAALLQEAEKLFGFTDGIEITLEANPSSVEAARFADLATAGINRVSLGMQSFHDDTLGFLGRAHDGKEGLAALATAQQHFARVSFDLIYALPQQSLANWQADLGLALSLGTEHLSLYQLTIEPGTRFATLVAKGDLTPLDDDQAADFFELTYAMTAEKGLYRYEISNHARAGAESRHNLIYWRYQDYMGIGPGAHGRRNALATLRHKKPENWLEAIKRHNHGLKSEDALSLEDQAHEQLLMGMRLAEGIDLTALTAAGRLDRQALTHLHSQGLLIQHGPKTAIAPQAVQLTDAILREMIA